MRKCILVLGMHRSGTSMLNGVLKTIGVFTGKDEYMLDPVFFNPKTKQFNAKGFFEITEITNFNEELLQAFDASWITPQNLPENWLDNKNIEIFKKKLAEIIHFHFKEINIFSIKDPRICLLLPIYEHVLTEMGIEIIYILINRNKNEVLRSLSNVLQDEKNQVWNQEKQANPDLNHQLYEIKIFKHLDKIYQHYINQLNKYLVGKKYLIISYNAFLEKTEINTDRLYHYINDKSLIRPELVKENIKAFVDKKLKTY